MCLNFSQPFSVSSISYLSEHNFILEHGWELTHSSMLMLTNNPEIFCILKMVDATCNRGQICGLASEVISMA